MALELADDVVMIQSLEQGDRLYLAEARLRRVRHQRARDVAAGVLVQLAARRLSGVPGPRRDVGLRSAEDRPGRVEVAGAGRDRAVGAWGRHAGRRGHRHHRAPLGRLGDDAVRQAPQEAARPAAVRSLCDTRAAEVEAPKKATARASTAKGAKKKADEPDPFGRDFEGVIPNLRRRFDEGSWAVQEELDMLSRAHGVCDLPGTAASPREPGRDDQGPVRSPST